MLTYSIRITVYYSYSLLMCQWPVLYPHLTRYSILFRVWSWGDVRIRCLVWHEFVLLGVRLLRRLLQKHHMHECLGSPIKKCDKSAIFDVMYVHCLFSNNGWWIGFLPQQCRIEMPH